jgi:hypothetical protein
MNRQQQDALHNSVASLERAVESLSAELSLLRGALYPPARAEDYEPRRQDGEARP